MWIFPAIASAFCLGLYDISKKQSVKDNQVVTVLFINTIISACLMLPVIAGSSFDLIPRESLFFIHGHGLQDHVFIVLKAIIVLSSWICGYFAIKNLPLTIAGPVNATRPVLTLAGGILLFGEQLNLWQWAGMITAVFSFYMIGRSGKKEGIVFSENKWVGLLIAAAVLGACSGLYDKFLIKGKGFDKMFVQSWYSIYQSLFMFPVWGILRHRLSNSKEEKTFRWRHSILLIPLFLTVADLFYLYSLGLDGSMIAVVSMIRRSSVIVSFAFGALFLKEKNLKGKLSDIVLIFISMIFLCFGSIS